ncbi:hypothetical protein KAR34_09315 [bacterium]|nr:hypothetical protein [bacterium]
MEIDKDLEKFIATTVDSLIMWELLVFLWNNPGTTDNADGISARLGRRKEDLNTSLTALCKQKVLECWGDNSDPVYTYHPSLKLAKAIEKFIQFNNTKHGKLMIWSELLKHGVR